MKNERIHISRRGSVDIMLGSQDLLPPEYYGRSGNARSRRVHLKDTMEETEGVIKILKNRMLEKTRKEAMLTQQVQQARADEASLTTELEKEKTMQISLRRRIEEAEDRRERLKEQSNSKDISLLQHDKQKSSLIMQIRDLNEQLNRTLSKERRVTSQLLHAQRKCREMETELADIRHDNQRTQDMVDNKEHEKYDLEDRLNNMKDITLRDAQRAQVDAVSLEKDLEIVRQDHREARESLENLNTVASAVMSDLELNQELHEKIKMELERRIEDEEAGNERIVQEIARVSRNEMDLLADIQTEENGIETLQEQLQDKSKMIVDTNRRICEIEQELSEFDRDLASKRMEIEECNRVLEMFKSQRTVLEAQVEKTYEQSQRVEKELSSEEATANELQERLRKLRDEESELRLRMSQGEADTLMLRSAMKSRTESEQETRDKLFRQREILETLSEQYREAKLQLQDHSAKLERKIVMVEKLRGDLQNLEADYNKAHRDLSMRKNATQGELDEHEDEVKRLEGELSTSDRRLRDMQDMITQIKAKNEDTQIELRSKIEEGTLLTENLEEQMRNNLHKNRLMSSESKKLNERLQSAEAHLNQNDAQASDMATLNSEETTRLTDQVRMESAKRDDGASALQQETNEMHRLQMMFDEVVQQKQRLGKQIRQFKFEAESAANEIESKKQGHLERTARIRKYIYIFSVYHSFAHLNTLICTLKHTHTHTHTQIRYRGKCKGNHEITTER